MAITFNFHGPQGSRQRGKQKPYKKKSSYLRVAITSRDTGTTVEQGGQ